MTAGKNHPSLLLGLAAACLLAACSDNVNIPIDIEDAVPAAPTNLTASASNDSVSLSWDEVNNASTYEVYRDNIILDSVSNNSFSESGLDDGTYMYKVASLSASGASSDTASVSVTIGSSGLIAPTDLVAEVSKDSASLTWEAALNASSYKVYRDSNFLSSVSINSFSESGLADGTYLYEVTSVNISGESLTKASVSATINTTPPNAPTGLVAKVDGSNVYLGWDKVSDATSYNVYRDGSLLETVSTNNSSDSNLDDGTYLYEIASVSIAGESLTKASVSATIDNSPPSAPDGLKATVNGDSVSLTWEASSDANSYNVYRDGNLLSSVSSNSFSESGLADATYLYEVTVVGATGESTDRASVSATINNLPPDAPTGLTATVDGDSVSLTWDVVSDASSYKVYRDGGLLSSVRSNSFSDSGLANATYLYEVTAVDTNGEGTSRASVSATVNNLPPDAPSGLTATVDGDSVSLTWNAVGDASGYNVYRDGGLLGSVSGNSFSDSGLNDGTYLYEVAAVSATGESASRAAVSVTIANSPPNAPTGLTATVSGDSVLLNWDAVSGASSYKVYRSGNFLSSLSSNSFNDTGLAAGTYLYEVTAVSAAGESTSRSSVSATIDNSPPNAPTGLTATVDGASVSLTWSAVSDASSYKVYRDGGLQGSLNTNSFNDSGLADGSYLYEVSSVSAAGESVSKASVSATIDNSPPNAPTGLTATVNGASVSLAWATVSDAISYKVYRSGSLLGSITNNSFNDSGLADGTYLYEVSSVGAAGESTSKASTSATIATKDPLYDHQWHLENTGQDAFAALNGNSGEDINHSAALALDVTGAGVRINVIDTGLEIQHPDLQANIVAGGSYNYLDGGTDPTNNIDSDGDHGTSVAGLIAAVGNNGIGVTGVASAAELQAYNYLSASNTTYSDYIFAHGGDESNLENTDIFNKSLGSSSTTDSRLYSGMLDALSCFTTGGSYDMSSTTAANSCGSALRSGLGAIYVKSAGNDFSADGTKICDSLGLTCWNVNMEAEETYPYQITVGALNANGTKSSYSTAGSAIWISAPGGEFGWDYDYLDSELDPYGYPYNPTNPDSTIWQPALITIDQVGCDRGYTTGRYDFNINGVPPIGYTSFHEDDTLNPNCEYTSTFNGTSSAAPVLSGVIALLLEANPSLSWRDVKHILASSARQVDSGATALEVENVVCTNSSCSSVELSDSLSFVARDAWITNAAGYNYHNWYGFGAVNAGAAVAMAQSYSSPLGAWQKISYQRTPALAIPDSTGAPATTTITVAEALTVEAVQLDLDITHSCIFELAVVLRSPSGTRSVLLTPYNQFNCDQDFSSTLLSNAFYRESAAGDWIIETYDIWETSTGTFDSVSLNIYGH